MNNETIFKAVCIKKLEMTSGRTAAWPLKTYEFKKETTGIYQMRTERFIDKNLFNHTMTKSFFDDYFQEIE
jgi:hypothetical protein